MAKQDDFIRLTLRLPPKLHEMLMEAAGPRSLNAEIIDRLQDSILDEQMGRTKSFETLLTSVAKIAAKQAVGEMMESLAEYQSLPAEEREEYARKARSEKNELNK